MRAWKIAVIGLASGLCAVLGVAIAAPPSMSFSGSPEASTEPVLSDGAATALAARPFEVRSWAPQQQALNADLAPGAFRALEASTGSQVMEFPLPDAGVLTLELERFEVVSERTRFVVVVNGQEIVRPQPRVVLLRGGVAGDPAGHAFVSFGADGSANGQVTLGDGRRYTLSRIKAAARAGLSGQLSIHRASALDGLPEFPEFCGVDHEAPPLHQAATGGRGGALTDAAFPWLGEIAVDGDQSYVSLFDTLTEAETYVVQVYGAISDIYERDVETRLHLGFVRLWPGGLEPFSADNLSGFRTYWQTQQDPTPYNVIQMLSGRRNLSYGGVGYVGGTCSGSATYSIAGYLLGGFPNPVETPSLGNWDLIVTAHEMGHNFGTYHTHDGFFPTIDDCGNGVPARGTIMSYCHIHEGGTLNVDMRFHRLVQEVMETDVYYGACFAYDCNGNNLDDLEDIASLASADWNGNGVPDECEDCNRNRILDDQDIAGGTPDVDGNGVPDSCQADCDGNNVPDAYESATGSADDEDGNNQPDVCAPDCNSNGLPDFAEIADGWLDDLDRDSVPDICQDCDANGTPDWIDLGRPGGLFVADLGDYVSELHAASGVGVRSLGLTSLVDPLDLTFGEDRQLYVADFGRDVITRIDVEAGTASIFVAFQAGGLDGPSGVAFGANGNLFVASQVTDSVLEYDGLTGAFVGVFVAPGSGGLNAPYGLKFAPNSNLLVTSAVTDSVIEYDGATGAHVGNRIAPGFGGLSSPRAVAFLPNGNLVVSSWGSDRLVVYSGDGSVVVGTINDVVPDNAWGVAVGPNGNIFAVRSSGTVRVIEYDAEHLRYVRSFVRGEAGLQSPTALVFRPASPFDCNENEVLDSCDIADGFSDDTNGNGTPDECEIPGDANGDGYVDLDDHALCVGCLTGPDAGPYNAGCGGCDLDGDTDVDLGDFAGVQEAF